MPILTEKGKIFRAARAVEHLKDYQELTKVLAKLKTDEAKEVVKTLVAKEAEMARTLVEEI